MAWLSLSLVLLLDPNVRGLLRPHDWYLWEALPRRLAEGTLYDLTGDSWFVWSPIAAWLLAYVVVPLG